MRGLTAGAAGAGVAGQQEREAEVAPVDAGVPAEHRGVAAQRRRHPRRVLVADQ